MTLLAIKHPVQLLCDAQGTYGIGVVSSAVEADHRHPPEVILRPDRLSEAKTHPAALQMIMGGFRHGMFSHKSASEEARADRAAVLAVGLSAFGRRHAGRPWADA
jgi:hypothetical protein